MATRRSWRAAFLGLIFSLAVTAVACPQSETSGDGFQAFRFRSNSEAPVPGCSGVLLGTPRLGRLRGPGTGMPPADEAGDGSRGFAPDGCTRLISQTPLGIECHPASEGRASGALCADAMDMTFVTHFASGKETSKISEAREKVLEILSSENACTEWFESKDAQPARTFQTLGVEVDRQGPQVIFETTTNDGMRVLRQPYVARATQDGGAFTAITINARGAFYQSQTMVQKTEPYGGPYRVDGLRALTVGVYSGDTLAARMLTLLHEFGHVIDLLPQDGDDLDGSSIRNTNEVLRHCRAALNTQVQEVKLTKTRHPL